MKHRPNMVERYADEVNNFMSMFNGEDDETAEDTYKKITVKGIYIIGFFLQRINDKLAFLLGILAALCLIRK